MSSDDPNMKYTIRSVQKRTIDTLVGISKGIVADGVVNQQEAESLLSWLTVTEATVLENPVTNRLLGRVEEMLEDKVFGQEEAKELLGALTALSGGISQGGEFSKSTTLPLDNPPPMVVFEGQSFLFTGTCMYGNRKQCQAAVTAKNGKVSSGVTLGLDYLVIGYYVTPSWKYESFGTKIEKAVDYRDRPDSSLAIIGEEHWMKEGNLLPL